MLNFFLGMMFIYILLPILESLMAVICSYLEVIKAKHNVKITEYNSKISQIIAWPGLQLQRLTTREPDDNQIEVGIASLKAAEGIED